MSTLIRSQPGGPKIQDIEHGIFSNMVTGRATKEDGALNLFSLIPTVNLAMFGAHTAEPLRSVIGSETISSCELFLSLFNLINKHMPRSGPRPHCWKVQGAENHEQYCAWLQMKAQAQYRKETFELTFSDFQLLWQGRWQQKGRGSGQYCLTRQDPTGAWNLDNVLCMPRVEHLRRQHLYKKTEKEKWQISQED